MAEEQNLVNVLLEHAARYPALQLVDLIKLIRQNEFGGAHFAQDEKTSLERLRAETQGLKSVFKDLIFENIGNGLCRLHLAAALKEGLRLATLNRFFLESAKIKRGSGAGFRAKLGILEECCQNGLLPFQAHLLRDFLSQYDKAGFSSLSHSPDYQRRYFPAYRVVEAVYRDFFAVFKKIDSLWHRQADLLLGIDGNCAAGKSMLADLVQAVYDCNVLRLDHFFLRSEQRTPQRLREVGGNFDYERFLAEAMAGLKEGKPFQYRIYDCRTQTFSWSPLLQPRKLTVVEGSYSLHPTLFAHYDLKIFLKIDPAAQRARILARNGPKMGERFFREWIPLENEYFREMQIEKKSDLVFSTADFAKPGRLTENLPKQQ